MIKILFVCHGNICRSAMAKYIFEDMLEKRGLSSLFTVDSAATSREEIGNPVYPPARKKLAEHGIDCAGHSARQVTKADYDENDYLIVMEDYNIRNLKRIISEDPERKVHKLLEYDGSGKDIDDPWYTGDFETTYREIETGLNGFLKFLGYER